MKRYLIGVCLALSVGAGCTTTTQTGANCESDADCTAPGTRCNLERKECICTTNEACQEGSFCNGAGVCQLRAGCSTNDDCQASNTYCDILSGKCLEGQGLTVGGTCGVASHCPYDSVCMGGTCQAGCFDDGDCQLGKVCADGQCVAGLCSNDGYCDYGERCFSGECKVDRRGPYCRSCSQRTTTNPEPCDDPLNFCLINNRELGGFTQFCGVDCSAGQACPGGYDCNRVVILTQRTCFNTAECRCNPNNVRFATSTCTVAQACQPEQGRTACVVAGEPSCNKGQAGGSARCLVPMGQTVGNCECSDDADCESGACTKANADDQELALCCSAGPVRKDRECRGGEGTVSGFCSCATDDDCPRDSCDTTRGACAITGRPCTVGGNECGAITCFEGGCIIGENCAPSQGLACSDVLPR